MCRCCDCDGDAGRKFLKQPSAHSTPCRPRCHPERNGGFATRSNRGVEASLPAQRTDRFRGFSQSLVSIQPCRPERRDPSTSSFHSQANGKIPLRMTLQISACRGHSHSIVPGGFEVTSYTTRFTPFTSFTIRLEIVFSTSCGSGTQSAVMPSSEWTARTAQV